MSKTILITGASSGIGKASARLFSEKGWNVIATMRQPAKEQELTNSENILITQLDVQQPDTIASAIHAGIAKFGAIDVLVNNAGYGEFGIFESTPREQTLAQFEVNVFGVMDTIRAILPHFRERKAGSIINISSGAGRFTLPMISLYCASKFALEGFSEALSFELAALNITVKIVEPGGTTTNFMKVSGERAAAGRHIADYDHFTTAAGKMFDTMRNMQLKTAEEVATVIYEAVTDGTDTLRYLVGNDDFKSRIDARLSMPDQQYMDAIKSGYLQFMD
jgi:NAD(P)-dependent dehydrogenase (short-subunit alcohol dehydrogenase family)